MRCRSCNYDNPADALFCMKCGAKAENRCSSCNTVNPADANFCRKCVGALGAAAPASLPSPAATAKTPRVEITHERQTAEGLEGERKTVTALFADIKGSTELAQNLDPEEASAIIDPALKLMIAAVGRYDGYVVQSTGDGIFAMFGAPLAHEDHPQRALYAALRMQDDLRRYAATLRERGLPPIEIRVGVNTGEVVVRAIQTAAGRAEYTPIGHSANLASRMQTVAATGTIAATEDTRRLCEGYFTFRALGPTRVKGVSEAVNVHEVTGLGPLRTRMQASARRGLSKFVGREAELAQIKRALELARAGHGQIVATVGEAGVGKSRLLLEFQAVGQPGCLLLETLSVSHGKASAYLPLIDLLKNYFDILPDDDARKRREKIAGKILILRSRAGRYPALYLQPARGGRERRRSASPARPHGSRNPPTPDPRCDQAPAAAREPQPAARRDLRGPALARRWVLGAAESAGRFNRHRAAPDAGQLPAGVHPHLGQQDLLHAAPA
jgi:class 3 adenylate cyclase/ribosomal protein L40E